MKVAIRVHTPKLSEAVQRMAGSYGWSWDIGDIPKSSENVLWFTNEVHRRKCITNSSENYLKGAGRRTADFILDALTDMSQIVEFFYKTGKVKETEMGKTTITDANHCDYSVSRDVHDMFTIKPNGCDDEYRFHEDQIKKLLEVKPEKHIEVKREIAGSTWEYRSTESNPYRICGCRFNDEEFDEIQEWLDKIKKAKRKK